MNVHNSSDRAGFFTGIFLFILFFAAWYWSLFIVGSEMHQGEVYRIIYLHVPSAVCAFAASFALFVCSALTLRSNRPFLVSLARASAEVGLLFTVLTLITGSIWGKPTWGTWWTWDGRLTTTFILAILFCGYLILWNSITSVQARRKACAVVGIMIFADVPIIYKSVTWWRTLHQPPSLMRGDGPTMSPEIYTVLISAIIITLLVCGWLVWQRSINLNLSDRIETETWRKMEG